ncbi:hypothetical protein [Pedobacter steynii]|uniref:DUF3945 domain-containing protein n=1 Tax=Pedobacter steynii TaxID=430522 RepID=A0A1D7QN43_9SPHI|nr:hypothetical protein [Pedobacter steynii]AOM80077.1 hypothetical protein BFS30_24690 [Pedobacter steynii]
MEQENFEKLKKELFYRGFGEGLNNELGEKMSRSGPEFAIEHQVGIEGDQMAYRLNFRKDDNADKYYFNTIDTSLLKNGDQPGQELTHSFPANSLVTATEMHHMLKHGLLVAVNKTLFNKEGEAYNTWASIDINGPKDDFGNYPRKTYHQNYFAKQPFDVQQALQDLAVPVKELEQKFKLGDYEKALKKANLPEVTIMVNGVESKGYLSVNPGERRIDVYDANMKIVQRQEQAQGLSAAENKKDTSVQQSGDVKKKPWEQQQRVNWNRNKGRGMGA